MGAPHPFPPTNPKRGTRVAQRYAMPQIFHRSMNAFSRVTIFGGILALGVVTWAWAEVIRAPYVTGQYVFREQPVPFSHKPRIS